MFELATFFKDFFKLPIPEYKKQWIAICTAMAVHTRKGDPGELLKKKRPNETQEVYEYRCHTFKHITYGSMNRATDELYRIVNGINYRINVSDKTRELLNNNSFSGMPFALYIQQSILRRMIEDPNGLLVWLPSGQGLVDSAEKTIPVPYVVHSSHIHYVDQNAIAFLSCEKSPVIVNKKEVYEGLVFYVLTKSEFYKIKQVGRKADNKFENELIYEHKMDEIPYCILGGDKADEGFFNSFFAPYLAFGDEALTQFSDFQAIMVTSGFPYIEEFLMECEITEEPNKEVPPGDQEETYKAKKYTWKKMPRSPHNTIERKIPDSNKDNAFSGDQILDPSVPSIRFIQANVETAKHAWEVVKEMITFAEDSLHLNLGRGFLSGDAKVEDKKSQQAMITKIGDNIFDNIMLNSVRFIDGYYNYRKPDPAISIDKPATYDIKTENDVMVEITGLKQGNAPIFFIQQATLDLAAKRFSGNKLMLKMMDILIMSDPLFVYTPAEKQNMVLAGTATKNEVILSQNAFSTLYNMSKEMGIDAFIQADNAALVDALNEKIAEFYPEEQTPIV